MNSETKMSATKFIWVAFLLGLIVVNANVIINGESLGIANVIVTSVVALAAIASTNFVWMSPTESTNQTTDAKLKRGERVKQVIDLMDEDELYELRQRLADDYSNPPSDYVVLGDDGELHRKTQS